MTSRCGVLFFLLCMSCGGGSDERPTCEALGEFCHDADTPKGIACHEFVESDDVTEDECIEKRDECEALCSK
jgi:hypothetical protein